MKNTEQTQRLRVFATCDIGQDALDSLRRLGYEVEVYDQLEVPPKSLIIAKVRSGIDGLITTLRDQIDAEVFEAGRVTRLSSDPNKGMAGRCVQGLIDVLEGNYGANPANMPYVVNKEAFR
jgi:hypothetical protein